MKRLKQVTESTPSIPIKHIVELLAILDKQYGYNFQKYSKTSMLRRIQRFMKLYHLKDVSKLRLYLLNNPQLINNFVEEITVNVTTFFRNPECFKVLREKVIPILQTYPFVRVWHAGCSSGEELYTTAIVFKEMGLLNKTRLYGTDISQKMLEKAKTAHYLRRNFEQWEQNYRKANGSVMLKNYFEETTNNLTLALKKDIAERSVFAFHNLVSDQSFNEFQMIFCRNVLIYFERNLQESVLQLIDNSLCKWGFLVLGTKESLTYSALKDKYKIIDAKYRIYQKIK